MKCKNRTFNKTAFSLPCPRKRQEVTTEGGLDVAGQIQKLPSLSHL